MQEKVFKSQMGGNFYVLTILALIVSLCLIIYGYSNYKNFFRDITALVPFCYLPIGLGILIFLVLIYLYLVNSGKKITVSPEIFSYTQGSGGFTVKWRDLIFNTTPPEKKRFRQITVSNGHYFGKIDEMFFPEYEFILEIIHRAKESAKSETFNV